MLTHYCLLERVGKLAVQKVPTNRGFHLRIISFVYQIALGTRFGNPPGSSRSDRVLGFP